MNIPKRHHYLPQFYLRNFTDNKGLLWVFDRGTNEYRQQHPVNTALQNDYYTFRDKDEQKHAEIEELFSSIEGKAKPVIDKLDRGNIITLEEKEILASFISFQKTRVPDFEKTINELSEKGMKKIVQMNLSSKEGAESFIKKYKKDTGKKIEMEKLIDVARNNEYSIEFQREWSLPMILSIGKELSKYFVNMDWVFLQAPQNSSFITCDSPFSLVPPDNHNSQSLYGFGLTTPGTKKQIPLSPKTCLVMLDYGHKILSKKIDRALIRIINSITARNSDRFVIAKDEALLKRIVEITKVDKWKKTERVQVS